ncbi:hypothetical protein QQ045_011529 [Rhodiola kirilowii]
MDEVRRWSVTFTKHIKQKRKVYQDGFLTLHTGSRKVKLYDDCENVLEIRILKNDEIVKAGETLTFHSHLVDVGDCEGDDDKPSHNVKIDNKVKNVAQSFGVRPAKKFRNISYLTRCPHLLLSVCISHPYILFVLPHEEWMALYSTHIMKKAKIYHDGYISLVSSGPRGRKVCLCTSLGYCKISNFFHWPFQVMLFDSRRNLLDSRFLKSGELVKSGGSLSFDGHMVDIGEPEANKPQDDNVVKVSNSVKERLNYHRLHKSPEANPTEWLVLYTTQLTQKAKKFHDGFLVLEHRGPQSRKVMLYDTSRRLQESRFLKMDEYISSNEPLSFGGHLVNVGEPKENRMPNIDLEPQRNEIAVSCDIRNNSCQGFVEAFETLGFNKNVTNLSTTNRNEIQTRNIIPLGHENGSIVGSFCTDDNRLSNTVPTNKPLRDVNGILSSLKRPFSNDNFTFSGHTSSVEQLLNHAHFQNQLEERPVTGTKKSSSVLGIREDVTSASNGGLGKRLGNQIANSKTGVGDISSACPNLMDSPDGFADPASQSAQELYTRPEQTPSMTGLQIVDSAKNLGAIEDRELKTTSSTHYVASANEETHVAKLTADICSKENLPMSSLTEILTTFSSHILEVNEDVNLKKDSGAESLPSNKTFGSSVSDNSPVVQKSVGDMDGWPSFDLGFE